jgi:long-subunit fatty acid transport protein
LIKRCLFIGVLTLCLLAEETKQAYSFDLLARGADAVARGGAYLTSAENAQPVFQNYAFLSSQTEPRASLTTFRLLNEVGYLAAAGTLGNFSFGVLNAQDSSGYMRDAENNLGARISYQDTTFYGACGWGAENFGLGTRLKYHSKNYSAVDISASGLALDFSGFYRLDERWQFGAAVNNAVASGLRWSTGLTEELPRTYELGGRCRTLENLDLYAETTLQENIPQLWRGGAELAAGELVTLRAGFCQTKDLLLVTNFTAGIGLRLDNVSLEYAYNPTDDLSGSVTHFFTLSYRLVK